MDKFCSSPAPQQVPEAILAPQQLSAPALGFGSAMGHTHTHVSRDLHKSPPRSGRTSTYNTRALSTLGWRPVGLPECPSRAMAWPETSSRAKHLMHKTSK